MIRMIRFAKDEWMGKTGVRSQKAKKMGLVEG